MEFAELLSTKFEELYTKLKDELSDNNVETLISLNKQLIVENRNLRERVETLENKLDNQFTVTNLVSECLEIAANDASDPTTPAVLPAILPAAPAREDLRMRKPTLILSHSMFKHVNVHTSCDKIVIVALLSLESCKKNCLCYYFCRF